MCMCKLIDKYYKYISEAKINKTSFTWVSSLGKCGWALHIELFYVNEAVCQGFVEPSFLFLLGIKPECISHHATVR